MSSFTLNSSISSSVQTVSLAPSGATQLTQQQALPFYVILTRVSDGAKEVVRAVAQVSTTDLTILRAQLGSTGLAFVAGDGADLLTVPVNLGVNYYHLGSPAVSSATGVHAAITLTASPQTNITSAITSPAVCRNITITGNAGGNAGTVTIHGLDALGSSLSEDIALSGTSTVAGVKAFATVSSIDVPAETHGGTDTVSIGFGAILGLPVSIPRNTVISTYLNNVREATAPTVAYGAVSASTITLSSTLNSTSVACYLING